MQAEAPDPMEVEVQRSGRAWRRLVQRVQSITPSGVVRIALVVAAAAVLIQLALGAWVELLPFQFGLALAYITLPLVNWLARWMPRSMAAIAVVIIELATIVGVIGLMIPPIVEELTRLVENLPTGDEVRLGLDALKDQVQVMPEPTRQLVQQVVQQASTAIRGNALLLAQSAATVLIVGTLGLINTLGFVIAFFGIPTWLVSVLSDQRNGVRTLNRVLPGQAQPDFWAIARILDHAFGTYIRGQLLLSVLVGFGVFGGLWLLEQLGIVTVRYRLVLAVIATLTQLVPTVGPILGALPAIMVGLTTSREAALAIGLVYVGIQQLVGTLFAPRIQRQSIDIHPAILVVALVLLSQFGILGVLLAAPLTVASRDVFRYVYGRFGDPPRPGGLLPWQPLPPANGAARARRMPASLVRGRMRPGA